MNHIYTGVARNTTAVPVHSGVQQHAEKNSYGTIRFTCSGLRKSKAAADCFSARRSMSMLSIALLLQYNSPATCIMRVLVCITLRMYFEVLDVVQSTAVNIMYRLLCVHEITSNEFNCKSEALTHTTNHMMSDIIYKTT